MESSFDLQLVEQFVVAIRGKGAVVLSSSNFPYSENHVSTPALVWLFSNRNSLPPKANVTEILDYDIKRQTTIVGHNIFKERCIDQYANEEAMYLQATEVIQAVWPQVYELILKISPRISFQTDDRREFESESDPKTFGEIIYNMKSECPVHWAEILVHEIAHHYLTVLLGTTKIDAETNARFKETSHSHQRQSQRPLIGVLHGVFAQSCILIFATKILLSQSYSQNWKDGARKTFERYAPIFPKDLETVETSGLIFHPTIRILSDQARRQMEEVNSLRGKWS